MWFSQVILLMYWTVGSSIGDTVWPFHSLPHPIIKAIWHGLAYSNPYKFIRQTVQLAWPCPSTFLASINQIIIKSLRVLHIVKTQWMLVNTLFLKNSWQRLQFCDYFPSAYPKVPFLIFFSAVKGIIQKFSQETTVLVSSILLWHISLISVL